MTHGSINRAESELEILESSFATDFVRTVEARLRRLTDVEVNALYLKTQTKHLMGEDVDIWTAVLMPIIEREADLRRDLKVVPYIGPVVAPDLYQKGGGHYVPF